jgi:hypothetical protein
MSIFLEVKGGAVGSRRIAYYVLSPNGRNQPASDKPAGKLCLR